MNSGRQYRNDNCPKCGSRNWQSIQTAYEQSVRITEGGRKSRSLFSDSISPPEPRSTTGGPFFSGFGMACGTLIFFPTLMREYFGYADYPNSFFDSKVYVVALLVGAATWFIHLVSATTYNTTTWSKDYNHWQGLKVCRNCGHKYRESSKV